MESEIDNVRAELDSLLERYLQALDDYGKARHDMCTFMSSVGAANSSGCHAKYTGIPITGAGKQHICLED